MDGAAARCKYWKKLVHVLYLLRDLAPGVPEGRGRRPSLELRMRSAGEERGGGGGGNTPAIPKDKVSPEPVSIGLPLNFLYGRQTHSPVLGKISTEYFGY